MGVRFNGIRLPDVLLTPSGKRISTSKLISAIRLTMREDWMASLEASFEISLYYPIAYKAMQMAGKGRLTPSMLWVILTVYNMHLKYERNAFMMLEFIRFFPSSRKRTIREIGRLVKKGLIVKAPRGFDLTPEFISLATVCSEASKIIIDKYRNRKSEIYEEEKEV